jgi:putative flippase GtrA
VPSFTPAEKLARFRSAFPGEEIGAFFSARLGDEPLAKAAKEAYLIRGGRALPWEEYLAKEGRLHAWLRHFLSPEFFRFWCVGWLNMAAAWLLEAGWSLVFSPNLAFTVGYLMSLFVSFILNSKITFRAPVSYLRFWRYLISYIPNFVVQSLTVLIFHNWLGLPHLLAYFIAAIVGTPVTFCCLKFFAFQKQAG